ncbi:MAG: hypothetical protein ACYC0J_03760, partial [Gammaproteobacteria bacterium]
MLTKLKQGIVTVGRYAFASVLSTCQYISSAGNLLVNLEGKLVNFAGSKNAIVNEVITGISTVASLLVTSFTRVPANFRLILAKPKKDDADPVAASQAPSWSNLRWKGRIFYLLNAPLSVLSCFFGPLNIYYFSHTVIMGLIYLLRKVMPAPVGQPDDEDHIMHMGSVITISVLILLARAVNTIAYDLKFANANTLEIASNLDKGELPANWSTLVATTFITLPSAVSVTLLAHNSTLKSLEHIAAQLP